MMMLYQIFYKQFGIRRAQQLVMPRVFSDSAFHFPRNSVYHHISHDVNNIGPDEKTSYFLDVPGRIMIDHLTTLTPEAKGSPRRMSAVPQALIRDYRVKNKHFKYVPDPCTAFKSPMILTAINYGFLQRVYRYTELPMTPYWQWRNIEQTAWDKIKELAETTERQQFVFFKVPAILPSISTLKIFSNKQSPLMLKIFDTPEKLFLLEMFKWLGEERELSLLAKFEPQHLEKINLVIQCNGRWTLLNLGFLNNSRKGTKLPSGVAVFQFPAIQLQKFFVRLLMQVQSQSTVEEPRDVKNTLDSDQVPAAVPELIPDDDDQDDDSFMQNAVSGVTNKTPPAKTDPVNVSDSLPNTDEDDNDYLNNLMKDIDKDLDAVEFIEKKSLMEKGIDVHNQTEQTTSLTDEEVPLDRDEILRTVYEDKTPSVRLKEQIDQYAEYGLMSASDYRTMLKQAEKFAQSPNPYNTGDSIESFVSIPSSALTINAESTKLPDIENVVDKTMLETSLKVFDSDYIKKIMPKDIVGMVNNVQNAGFIIQGYEIENDSSVIGDFEIHTIKVKPIDGVSSTLRFRLPKVNEEGDFFSGGNKYRMRKQRGD